MHDQPALHPTPADGFAAACGSERRTTDRRRRPTPMLSRWSWLRGRRAGDRRDPTALGQYVDRYDAALAGMLVAIGVLCAFDAIFTLLYLQRGGSEANPVMAAIIEWGPRPFMLVKCGVTNLGLLVLCLHKNFRFVRPVIAALLAVYVALMLYHLLLATMVP